jgi:hypothetical protein
MKRCALYLLVSLLLASVSPAQQNAADAPASKEDIERHLQTVQARDLIKARLKATTKELHKIIHNLVKNQPDLWADLASRMDNLSDGAIAELSDNKLAHTKIPAYQRHLAEGDIDASVTLYSSPTGQRISKELPTIQAEAMQAASGTMQRMMEKAVGRLQEEVAQAQKAGDAGPPDENSARLNRLQV